MEFRTEETGYDGEWFPYLHFFSHDSMFQTNESQKPLLLREIYEEFVAPYILPSIDDWYNLSDDVIYTPSDKPNDRNPPAEGMTDLEKLAHRSFEDCGRACVEQSRCYQWVYFDDTCGFSHSFRFGRKRKPEDGVSYKSGFDIEKIEQDVKDHPCPSPLWLS